MPSITENSCETPSMRTAVIAVPGIEESKALLNEFPIVVPKPLSNGSAINLA